MRVCCSEGALRKFNYDFVKFVEEGVRPESTGRFFYDIVPELKSLKVGSYELYSHQLRAYEFLERGCNVILVSGTGSGKTEAWALYALRNHVRVLAVYPTLALTSDQILRLEKYYDAIGLGHKVLKVNSREASILKSVYGGDVYRVIGDALLVITNPAFLMSDLKRTTHYSSKSYLGDFLEKVDLIVVDELDCYRSRGATLLVTMLEIISKFIARKPPQICVLTATLGNPETLKELLEKITGRKTYIVRGKPFKVKNITYLILGKSLEKFWKQLLDNIDRIEETAPEVIPLIRNFDDFKTHYPDIVAILRDKGFKIPEIFAKASEIIKEYASSDEDGVTIVFTRSIRSAEKLAKEVRSQLPETFRDRVYAHHHLISKDKRREIEEKARKGEVKVIISPRTLVQGIDIGTVVRIVHYGLPQTVREFRQREGRKGRREEIPFTESIIIPIYSWDRKLLEAGVDKLKKWTELPLENVFINPDNKYPKLFRALYKVRKGIELSQDEMKLLLDMKLIEKARGLSSIAFFLTNLGKRVWRYFNFYEFGPAYGVKRVLEKEEGMEVLEEVSRRDFIEKLQVGCFDPSSDAIVTEITEGRNIIEKPILKAISESHELASAHERYMLTKYIWGEYANLLSDYARGKLFSRVRIFITIPLNGFGRLFEHPEAVEWIIESSKPRVIKYGRECRVLHRMETIELDVDTCGVYEDFTYGYRYELDPEEDTDLIKAALALLKVILRLSSLRISPEEIEYDVVKGTNFRFFILWEPEASGILEKMDWKLVRSIVREYKPDRMTEFLLWAVDEEAMLYILEKNISLDSLKEVVERVIDYIEGIELIEVVKLGKVRVPKPRKELNLVAIDLLTFNLKDEEKLHIISLYNGEKSWNITLGKQIEPGDILGIFNEAIGKDTVILHYSTISKLVHLLSEYPLIESMLTVKESKGQIVNVYKFAKETLCLNIAPLVEVAYKLGIKGLKISHLNLNSMLIGYRNGRISFDKLIEYAKETGIRNAKAIYQIYLVSEAVRKRLY
ncbi:MAG TPA: DEAD/DEAH box helicase [Candidatus Bathyarchaeota archaeon]|nr:DEAD/DEAH box helicase [Candidatus Bathyarchaeota archaeon]